MHCASERGPDAFGSRSIFDLQNLHIPRRRVGGALHCIIRSGCAFFWGGGGEYVLQGTEQAKSMQGLSVH